MVFQLLADCEEFLCFGMTPQVASGQMFTHTSVYTC